MSDPVCTVCKEALVPGVNWSPSQVKRNSRQCKACNTARAKKWNRENPGKRRRHRKKYRQTPRGRYLHNKWKALEAGKTWTLSLPQFKKLIKKCCTYCGAEPISTVGSWLDRIDNKCGYATDNVVPCCGECNRVRSDVFTYDEMKNVIGPALRAVMEARYAESVLHSRARNNSGGTG